MIDPFKTPESDLGENGKPGKTKWKIFFWLVLVLEIASIISMVFDPQYSQFELVLEFIVYSAILVGLFGFAFDKKLFFRKFWVYLVPTGLIYDVVSIGKLEWGFQTQEELYFVIGALVVIGLPIIFFQYYALYCYGNRSPEIWSGNI